MDIDKFGSHHYQRNWTCHNNCTRCGFVRGDGDSHCDLYLQRQHNYQQHVERHD